MDGDDGSPLLYMNLIVVSRQFGGASSLDLMASLYSRSLCLLALLVECLIISALTPLVSAALPLLSWLMTLLIPCTVNGVSEWCKLLAVVLVFAFVSSSLTCRALHGTCCLSYLLVLTLSYMCVTRTCLCLVFHGSRSVQKIAQGARDVVSSFFVCDRA